MNIKALSYYDTRLFFWLFRLTKNRSCRPIIWVSKTGDGYLYFVIGVALWAFEPDYGTLFLFTTLMAYSLELPIYIILKSTLRRPRPCDFLHNMTSHITPADKFSLPSGHTAAAWLMSTIVAYFYPPFWFIAYGWASMIGISRVLLGVHYPSDVLAGMTLGILIANFSLAILA
ncbi:phosphatase PAP2 family protein [Ningiella sp. W23]|uniref:phosphatase PAP2 family protein n=1 Tax=Ningiella sp. W23 TaxID=3023715 RepID=UPI003756C9BD